MNDERFEVDGFWEGFAIGLWRGIRSKNCWALAIALAVLGASLIYG